MTHFCLSIPCLRVHYLRYPHTESSADEVAAEAVSAADAHEVAAEAASAADEVAAW